MARRQTRRKKRGTKKIGLARKKASKMCKGKKGREYWKCVSYHMKRLL